MDERCYWKRAMWFRRALLPLGRTRCNILHVWLILLLLLRFTRMLPPRKKRRLLCRRGGCEIGSGYGPREVRGGMDAGAIGNDCFGKPDGGNGGRGGDIILECSSTLWDFNSLQHHLRKGGNGVSKYKTGTRGSDKVVQVPVGTVVLLVSGEVPSLVQDISTKSLHPWEFQMLMELVH